MKRRHMATLAATVIALAFVAVDLGQAQPVNLAAPRGNKDFDEAVQAFLNKKMPKIVGGVPAQDGAYPWQVSLGVAWIADPGRAHFCGGSIHNSRWIVTAAHCLANLSAQEVHVVTGTNTLKQGLLRINAKRLLIHKSYTPATSDNDVGLIELDTPISLGPKSKIIALLDAANEGATLVAEKQLTVTGWGATEEGGDVVRTLREVAVPFVTRNTCNDPLSYNGKITDNMICAGKATGGVDSCQGDSGGPLVSNPGSPNVKLAGIVSWGEGCAEPGKYGVYTRVPKFVEWIAACVANNAAVCLVQ